MFRDAPPIGLFILYKVDNNFFSYVFQDGRRQVAVEAQGAASPAVAGPPVLPALGN